MKTIANPERLELRPDRRGLPPTRRLAVLQHVARVNCNPRIVSRSYSRFWCRPLFLPLEIHTNSESLENKEGWNLRDRFPHKLKATRINVETDGKQPAWLHCRLVRGAPAPLLLAKAPSLTSLSLINITLFSVRQLPMHPPKRSLDMTLILVREGLGSLSSDRLRRHQWRRRGYSAWDPGRRAPSAAPRSPPLSTR